MTPILKRMIVYLAIAGGIISILGDATIRFVLFIFGGWNVSLPWYFVLLDSTWVALEFVSGIITVSIFLPFIIPKVRNLIGSQRGWLAWGMSLGAFAGICNAIILASIHLSIMSGLGQYGLPFTLKLMGTYLPIVIILMGIPAAIVGAISGMIACLIFSKLEGSNLHNRF